MSHVCVPIYRNRQNQRSREKNRVKIILISLFTNVTIYLEYIEDMRFSYLVLIFFSFSISVCSLPPLILPLSQEIVYKCIHFMESARFMIERNAIKKDNIGLQQLFRLKSSQRNENTS